jgi:hypothetical protein
MNNKFPLGQELPPGHLQLGKDYQTDKATIACHQPARDGESERPMVFVLRDSSFVLPSEVTTTKQFLELDQQLDFLEPGFHLLQTAMLAVEYRHFASIEEALETLMLAQISSSIVVPVIRVTTARRRRGPLSFLFD